MAPRVSDKSPRQRILATALDLFYRQGYSATGVNQIISEADVAKASFYDHFVSKEALLVAYAIEISRQEMTEIRKQVLDFPSPIARFYGPLDILIPWFESSGFRGCPFQNMMAEVPPDLKEARDVARHHRESVRIFLRELAMDLKNSSPEHATIDPEVIATAYLILFEGAIATSVAYRSTWPVEAAKETLKSLLSK